MTHPNRPRPRARTLATTAAALAIAATGCGSDDDTSADQPDSADAQIRSVYKTHIDATYENDVDTVCDTMTPAARRRVGTGPNASCQKTFKDVLASGTLSPNRPKITKLDINGQTAKGLVKAGKSNPYPIHFKKHNGQWKLTAK